MKRFRPKRQLHGYGGGREIKSRPMPGTGTVVQCSCGFTAVVPDVPARCPWCRVRMSVGNRISQDVSIKEGEQEDDGG